MQLITLNQGENCAGLINQADSTTPALGGVIGYSQIDTLPPGVVNVVSRSGKNQIHGAAFETFLNDKLDARNFFDVNRAPLRQNQFGAAFGGAIKKDKLFYFGDVQFARIRQGTTQLGTVPTAAELAGNLSDISKTMTNAAEQNEITPDTLDKRSRTPYVQEWNFGIQHTFAKDWLLDVSYLGDVGQHLFIRNDENYPTSDPTGTIPYANRVSIKGFGAILHDHAAGWSSLNGLLTKLEHRFSNGLYLLPAYTWSHGLDLGTTDDASLTSGLHALNKGNDDFDVRNRFVLSWTYELPIGRAKRFASGASGALDRLISGWKLDDISTFNTGQYVTVVLPTNWTNNGAGAVNRPDLVGNPYPAQQNYLHWLNINSFVYPGCPSYTACTTGGLHITGNAGRTDMLMPGENNWDVALVKDTRVTESKMVQFRAEFFNAWNHTQIGSVTGMSSTQASLNPTAFGTISWLRIEPREIQFALKFLW